MTVETPVAILHDYESLWIYDEQPHSEGASYWGQVMLFYDVLRSLGVDVDIRHADADLSGYRLIVAPALQLMGDERARHLTETARTARFLFGPRTAYRTPTGRVHENGQPGPLRNVLGLRLLNFDGLRPGLGVHVGLASGRDLGRELRVPRRRCDAHLCRWPSRRSGRRRPSRQRHHRRCLEPITDHGYPGPMYSPSSRSQSPPCPLACASPVAAPSRPG